MVKAAEFLSRKCFLATWRNLLIPFKCTAEQEVQTLVGYRSGKHGPVLTVTFANEPGSFQWFKLLEGGGGGEVAGTGTRKCGPESLNNPSGMVVVGHPAFPRLLHLLPTKPHRPFLLQLALSPLFLSLMLSLQALGNVTVSWWSLWVWQLLISVLNTRDKQWSFKQIIN
jgi:hypothetical protein